MKRFISSSLMTAVCAYTFSGCGSARLTTAIDKGKIEDNITIHLTNIREDIKPEQFFTLSQLGLKAGTKAWSFGQNDVLNAYRKLEKDGYPSYDITIDKPGYNTYYGRIAFLNASKNNTDAVTRYYEIKIPDEYFERAKGGRIACVYEYSNQATGTSVGAKVTRGILAVPTMGLSTIGGHKGTVFNPTWIIWLSDTPL